MQNKERTDEVRFFSVRHMELDAGAANPRLRPRLSGEADIVEAVQHLDLLRRVTR
jgi:hypothetical protein